MTSDPATESIHFGPFEVNLRKGELRKHGIRIKLQGLPFRLLLVLLEHPGEVVTREELQKRLWPTGTHVEIERGIGTALNKVRAALGDSAAAPRFIETIPRKGYCFIAPVESKAAPVPEAISAPSDVRRRTPHLILAGVMVGIAMLTVGSSSPSRALPFHERDWVLVNGFENRSGDAAMDNSLQNVLTWELSNSSFVFVAGQQRVASALQLMRRPPDAPLDANLAREVCLRDGNIRALVTGITEKLGSSYVLKVQIVDPYRNEPVAIHSETATDTRQIWPAIRKISNWVRESLGESMRRIDDSNPPFDRVTTPSLEAVRLFTEADQFFQQGLYAPTAQKARLAIAKDPSFASAYLLLAYSDHFGYRAFPGEGAQALERARQLSGTVSGREKALIDAVSLFLTHDYTRALPAVQAVDRDYPDNYLGYTALITMYRAMGHVDLARKAAARVADAERTNYNANAVAADMLLRCDLERGAFYARRARDLARFQPSGRPQPEDFFVRMSYFTELWLRDDIRGAFRELERVSQLPDAQLYAAAIARSYMLLGRFRDARQWAARLGGPDPIWEAYLAYYTGNETALLENLRKLLQQPVASGFPFMIWQAHFDLAGWRQKYASVMSSGDQGPAFILRAEVARLKGDLSGANTLLQRALEMEQAQGTSDVALIAEYISEAEEATGDLSAAAAVLESVSDERAFQGDQGLTWLLNQAHRAKLDRMLNRVAEAIKIEDELKRLFAFADPDNPLGPDGKGAVKRFYSH